jgi:DNA-binding CsgD family transcriptional regulator
MPSAEVLDLLDRLVAQSLVVADDAGPVLRFRLLETVRQYADRQLDAAGETAWIADCHMERYLGELLRVGPDAEYAFDIDEFRWTAEELENLTHAVRRATAAGRLAEAVDAVWYLSLAWGLVDPPACERLLDVVVAAWTESGDPSLEPKLRLARTQLQLWAGNMIQCAVEGFACIDAARATGDEWVVMRANTYLGQVVAWVDPDASLVMHHEARDAALRMGDPVGATLATVGIASTYVGVLTDLAAAKPFIDEAIERADHLGNPLLQSWSASQHAIWCGFSGQLPEAERWASVADRHLEQVGEGLGPAGVGILHRSVIRSSTIYAQSYARAQVGEHLDWIESLPALSARSVAAGYLVTPAMIEVIHGAQMTYLGRFEEAEASLARGRAINERAGTEAAGVSGACFWTDLALAYGDLDEAKRRLATTDGSMIAARSIHARSRIAKRRAAFALLDGEPLEAERLAHEGLALVAEQGIPLETFEQLEVLAQVAAATGAPEEAARIAGSVCAIRTRHGISTRLAWHADQFDATIDSVRESLGGETFDRAFAEGEALSTDEAVAYVQRARGERKRPSFGWEGLTPTELEVVGHVTAGLTNPQVAEAMFISRETVKTHLSHIFAKLGVTSRAELAAEAARRELST